MDLELERLEAMTVPAAGVPQVNGAASFGALPVGLERVIRAHTGDVAEWLKAAVC
jgi:hypothetical protein